MQSIRILLLNLLALVGLATLLLAGCRTPDAEKKLLLTAINAYETAWAEGDFLTVETFFAADAKRLHTEPQVWDRAEIKRFFVEKAAQQSENPAPSLGRHWREQREYLDIRVEGNIGYDIFTTERFKALHIWEKQPNGSWKIKYDVGMLNNPEANYSGS